MQIRSEWHGTIFLYTFRVRRNVSNSWIIPNVSQGKRQCARKYIGAKRPLMAHWLCSCQILPKIEFQNFQIGIFASKNYQKYFLLKILKTTINGSNLSKYELPTPSGSWDRSILLNRKPDFGKSEMSNVKKKKICDAENQKSRYLDPKWIFLAHTWSGCSTG